MYQSVSTLRYELPHARPGQHHVRNCRFEHLEARQLLAADLVTGGVVDHPGGPTGSISGNAFAIMAHTDCADHLASQSLSGALIQLLDENGNVLEQQRTNITGSYQFTDLMPGQYALRQKPMLENSEITVHMGGNGESSLSANELIEVTVTAGATTTGYDFCNRLNDVDSNSETQPDNDKPYFIASLTLQEHGTAPIAQLTLDAATIESGTPAKRTLVSPTLVQQSLKLEMYGGSARRTAPTSKFDTWDDELLDEAFSATLLGEIAAIKLTPASDEAQKNVFPTYHGLDETDAAFADGATLTSTSSTSEPTAIAIRELFAADEETDGFADDIPQVALLPEN